jgi:hypothetical protein
VGFIAPSVQKKCSMMLCSTDMLVPVMPVLQASGERCCESPEPWTQEATYPQEYSVMKLEHAHGLMTDALLTIFCAFP